jgi:hypothetical protein
VLRIYIVRGKSLLLYCEKKELVVQYGCGMLINYLLSR